MVFGLDCINYRLPSKELQDMRVQFNTYCWISDFNEKFYSKQNVPKVLSFALRQAWRDFLNKSRVVEERRSYPKEDRERELDECQQYIAYLETLPEDTPTAKTFRKQEMWFATQFELASKNNLKYVK